jgi:hypothetical protein
MCLFSEANLKDREYTAIRSEEKPWHRVAKKHCEELYRKYGQYLDKEFPTQFPKDFFGRLWELTIIDFLFSIQAIQPCKEHKKKNDDSPDFSFFHNGHKFYVEATSPSPGEKLKLNEPYVFDKDSVISKAKETPISEYQEAFTSAIFQKGIKKYNSNYKKHIENDNAGFIIAISMAKIPDHNQARNFNVELDCLFARSNLKIPILSSCAGNFYAGAPYREQEDYFLKKNSQISKCYFTSKKHDYISAVLISWNPRVFFPDVDKYEQPYWEECRNDFMLVHNPHAKIKLLPSIFPVKKEVCFPPP